MKQALVESAIRIDGPHMYEQGQGKLNIIGAKVQPRSETSTAAGDLKGPLTTAQRSETPK